MRADENAGKAIAAAGDDIGEEAGKIDANAGGARRLGVTANRVERRAEARRFEPKPEQNDAGEQQYRHRQNIRYRVPEVEVTECARNEAAWLLHDQQGHALRNEHRGKRHDDWLQAQKGDEHAIEGASRHADADASESPQRDRRVCRSRIHARGQDHIDERDDRTGGEIKTAGEDHQRLAHGSQGKRCTAARHEADVEIAEMAGADRVDQDK